MRALEREALPYVEAFQGFQRMVAPTLLDLAWFIQRAREEAERIAGPGGARGRQVQAAIEARDAMQTLASVGGPRGLRELQEARRALEHAGLIRREALATSALRTLGAPSPPSPPLPPAPPPEERKREAAKQGRKAAARRRGEELRALAPRAQLACLRSLLRRRPHAKVAADYGMTADELRDLIERARSAIAPRGHRKRG